MSMLNSDVWSVLLRRLFNNQVEKSVIFHAFFVPLMFLCYEPRRSRVPRLFVVSDVIYESFNLNGFSLWTVRGSRSTGVQNDEKQKMHPLRNGLRLEAGS